MTTLRILFLVGLQTAALFGMVADRVYTLAAGKVITLEVIPVDPTDMFRGDYVILSYKISRLDLSKLGGDDDFNADDSVRVLLAQSDGAWSAVSVHKGQVKAAESQILMRGKVRSLLGKTETAPGEIDIDYGIESFFVPQGTGKAIEDERQAGKVTADIALGSDGQAVIKALKIDGKPVYEESLF